MDKPLVNRIASSGLITIKPEEFFPKQELMVFDIKDYLYQGLILKEKEFRTALQDHDWTQYHNKNLTVYCSVDAIVPMWSYMLVVAYAQPYADDISFGDEQSYYHTHFLKALDQLDYSQYAGQRIVIKGCADQPVPPAAYVELTRRLRPIARSIMFGEPCSTVPIFKQPRTKK